MQKQVPNPTVISALASDDFNDDSKGSGGSGMLARLLARAKGKYIVFTAFLLE